MGSTLPEQQDQRYIQSGYRGQIKYKKTGNTGIEGALFQVNLLTIFLLNAIEKIHSWRLSTENEEAGKFDDLIFEQPCGAVLLQAKHKKNDWKKITYEDLVSTNSKKNDFSLPKYFLSYQEVKHKFRVRNVVICTNAYIEIEEGIVNEPYGLNEGNMLYFEGIGNVCYTFHDQFISSLEENIRIYHRKNLQGKSISDEVISKENIRDFLNHLQFIAGYPGVDILNQIIKGMISQSKFCRHLDCEATYKFVLDKVMEWFKQKNGIYLNQDNAKAIFCDITSKRYCQILEQYRIFFGNDHFLADSNKKILHLINPGECLLYVMRVYRTLGPESVLFANSDDGINVQNGIIDCFEETRYTYLVLVCSKMPTEDVKDICSKINGILDRNDKKRVILVAPVQDKIAEQLKTLTINSYEQVDENISLANLREDTQKSFLEKTVSFQGYDVSLGELLANENLNQIVNSEMLAKLARNEKVDIGTNLKPFNENLSVYYIPRSFYRNDQHVSEEDISFLDENHSEKVILISDCAGMGKSTVLTKMAVNIKENDPNLWVIRIDINSYVNILQEIKNKDLNFITIRELLDSQNHTRFKSDFERKLFLVPGKVVLMIDGLDEISPNFTDIILNLIVDIKAKPNFVKIFVTTRPNVCDALECSLKVKSFALKPFSKQNEIDFLCKYWRSRLDIRQKNIEDKCYIYAEQLVTKMSVWVNESARHTFAGIPLQTRMLAEVFQEKVVFNYEKLEQWEGCEEFLKSNDDVPQLPGQINLTELYKIFIDKKRDIFVRDKSNSSGSIVAEKAVQEIFKKCYNCHYGLAYEVCFAPDCYKINREYLEDVIKMGIVQRINGRLEFIHRTFAEYFAAEWLLRKIKSEDQNKKFQKFFIHYILYWNNFSIIRAFLDSFFQKELHSFPRSIFEPYQFLILPRFVRILGPSFELKDCVLHILSEEGCTNILSFLFRCLDFNNIKNPLYRAVAMLTTKGLNVDWEDILGRTALQKAARHGHLDVVKLLLNRGANVIHTDKACRTPLHEAVIAHSLGIEKKIVKGGENYVNSKSENSLDIVKLLVRKGASVNVKDMTGYTPLHIAVSNGNIRMAKFVIKEGADVNNKGENTEERLRIRKKVTETASYKAAYNGNMKIAKFLVKKGADVDIKNADGYTALHIAAIKGNIEMIKFLVEKGADVNIQDKYGWTALHLAAQIWNIEIVNLVETAADVNIKDRFG